MLRKVRASKTKIVDQPSAPRTGAGARQRLADPFGNDVELLIDGEETSDSIFAGIFAREGTLLIQFTSSTTMNWAASLRRG